MDTKIPDFVRDGAFNWLRKGYHYTLTDEELFIVARQSDDKNPWYLIAKVVEEAKQGDFSNSADLSKLYDVNLETNAAPVSILITGDLGKIKDLETLTRIMINGPDGFRVYACRAAANSGCLWLIPHMLEAWHLVDGIDAHENIGYAIADLLDFTEDDLDYLGPIALRAGIFSTGTRNAIHNKVKQLASKIKETDSNGVFHEIVMRRYYYLIEKFGTDQAIVWSSEPRNICEFAEYFLNAITSDRFKVSLSPLVVSLRQKFEASTGIDCTDFFDNGRLRQIVAVGTLEKFIDGAESKRFQRDIRYFFGHPIPQ